MRSTRALEELQNVAHNGPTIKPIDTQALVAASRETGGVVTVEEHQRAGGLGGAVAETLSELAPCPVVRLGMDDLVKDGDISAHMSVMPGDIIIITESWF